MTAFVFAGGVVVGVVLSLLRHLLVVAGSYRRRDRWPPYRPEGVR